MPAECPTASTLRRLLDGTLAGQAEADVTDHLDGCPHCRQRLERLAAPEPMAVQIAQRLAQATPAPQAASSAPTRRPFVELLLRQKVTAVALLLLTSLVAWTAWPTADRLARDRAGREVASPSVAGESTPPRVRPGDVRPSAARVAANFEGKAPAEAGELDGAVASDNASGQVRDGSNLSNAAVWCVRDESGDRRFESLEEALAACPQDGLIEVEASGTVRVAPLRLAGRRVTIRGADGFQPTIVPDGWAPGNGSPWWRIDHSRIAVEQLTFDAAHTPQTRADDTDRQVSAGSAAALWHVRDAVIEVRHCRLEKTGGCLFRLDSPRGLMCADSECLARTGTVFECVGAVAANVSVDHCVLAGESIVRVPADSGGLRLRMKNCAVLGAALAAVVDAPHAVVPERVTGNASAQTLELLTRDCWFVVTTSWFTARSARPVEWHPGRSSDARSVRQDSTAKAEAGSRNDRVHRSVVVWADTRSVASFATPWFHRPSSPESAVRDGSRVGWPPGWRLPDIRILGAAEDLREQAAAAWSTFHGRGWYDVLSRLGGVDWPVPLDGTAIGPQGGEGS